MTRVAGFVAGALWLLTIPPAMADPVFVRGREAGAGYTVSNGSRCFVITPLHVLKEQSGPGTYLEDGVDEFAVTDARGVRAKATILQLFRDDDLALGEIRAPAGLACPKRWSDGRTLERQLKPRARLMLTQVGEGRSTTTTEATLRGTLGDSEVTLEPARPGDVFQEGMSGSLVTTGAETAGMLMSVETATRLGRVLRQDRIHQLLGSIVVEPRDARVALAVMPFTDKGREQPVGTAAVLKAIMGQPRFTPTSLAPGASTGGLRLEGMLISVSQTRAANPRYIRPMRSTSNSNNLLGNLAGNALGQLLKKVIKPKETPVGAAPPPTDTASPYISTYIYEIAWKVIRGDGAIVLQDVDRRALSVGSGNVQRGVTESVLLEKAVGESATDVIGRL